MVACLLITLTIFLRAACGQTMKGANLPNNGSSLARFRYSPPLPSNFERHRAYKEASVSKRINLPDDHVVCLLLDNTVIKQHMGPSWFTKEDLGGPVGVRSEFHPVIPIGIASVLLSHRQTLFVSCHSRNSTPATGRPSRGSHRLESVSCSLRGPTKVMGGWRSKRCVISRLDEPNTCNYHRAQYCLSTRGHIRHSSDVGLGTRVLAPSRAHR